MPRGVSKRRAIARGACAAPPCPRSGERRGDRVAEVVAAVSLLVVGAPAPGSLAGGPSPARRPRRRPPPRPSRAASPCADRPGTGSPVRVEPRRGIRGRAAAGTGYLPRLGFVARRGEGDRHARRVARPDVGPARPGAGDDRAAPPIGQPPAAPAASAGTYAAPSAARPHPSGRARASQCRSRRHDAGVQRLPVGPRHARLAPAGHERRTTPGSRRRIGGSVVVPPDQASPAKRASTPSAIPARAQATPQSKQPRDAPGASLPPAQPCAARPGRGSSVGRAHD